MTVTSREKYEEGLSLQKEIPLYAEPWWLDAVCGIGKWETYVFTDSEGNEAGCIPYYKTKVSSLNAVITPPLTQWLNLIQLKHKSSIDMDGFIKSKKKLSIIDVSFKISSGQMILHKDSKVHLKYSFIIPFHSDIQAVRSGYNEGLRRNLREAGSRYIITESKNADDLLLLCKTSFKQRDQKAPAWIDKIVPAAHIEMMNRNRGKIFTAFMDTKAVASIFIGWDQSASYYLTGGRIDADGASAHALLLDHAIADAVLNGRRFDFEGSMIPGIANFFQSFGATPHPYLQIKKYTGLGILWSLFH